MTTTEKNLAEIRARCDAATEGPWTALGSGVASGDHWHVFASGEAVAHISSQDGVNEDQREPDAEFIAHSRTDLPALLAGVEAVMKRHAPKPIYVLAEDCKAPEDHEHGPAPDGGGDICWDEPTGETYCNECNDVWGDPVAYPCPTIQDITSAPNADTTQEDQTHD